MIGVGTRIPRDGPENLLRRDGHLSELSGERWRLGELTPAANRVVESHLEACDGCRAQAEADESVVDNQASDRLFEAASMSTAAPAYWRNSRWAWASGVAAAVILLVLWPREPTDRPVDATMPSVEDTADPRGYLPSHGGSDDMRRKGEAFELEVYVHDGERSRLASSGDLVHVGDRLGFRLFPRFAGHVMIVGHDSSGQSYLCYPQDSGGRSAPVAALDEPLTLDQAVQLDETIGTERIVALLCPHEFQYEDVVAGMHMDSSDRERSAEFMQPLLDACLQRELRLVKRAGGMAP